MFTQPDKRERKTDPKEHLTRSLPLSNSSGWLHAGRRSFPSSLVACLCYIFLRGHSLPHRYLCRVTRFERQVNGTKKHQVWLSLLTSPSEIGFLAVIYTRLVGAQLPPSPLSSSTPPQGDNTFAPPLRSPSSWQSDNRWANLQQPLISHVRTPANTPPSSGRHSSFGIFTGEVNKQEQYTANSFVSLQHALVQAFFFFFFLIPITHLQKFGLWYRYFSLLSE